MTQAENRSRPVALIATAALSGRASENMDLADSQHSPLRNRAFTVGTRRNLRLASKSRPMRREIPGARHWIAPYNLRKTQTLPGGAVIGVYNYLWACTPTRLPSVSMNIPI